MRYVTREGTISGTVDVETALTTLYDDTTPGPITVPTGCSKLGQLVVCIGSQPSSADGNTNFLLRLTGDGVKDGEHTFAIANAYQIFTTGGDTGYGDQPACRFDVDIDVTPGGKISVFATQAGGVTIGGPEICVMLGFA